MTKYSLTGKKVWVSGHNGMVGSALVRRLGAENPSEILTASRSELNLLDQAT
jgi:GDP-L-fucose synthase